MPPAAAASPARIDPRRFLWLLLALALATMNAPQDIWDTIRHLRVPDTDDAMRLVEVRDLLAGQGWYDNVQYRFLAPEGVASHWSRLVDAPLAGLIQALTPLCGQALAEGLIAAFWPVLLFGLFCALLYRGVQSHFGGRAALLALLVATQTFGIAIQFQPGRVDHHNVQILAMLGLALCLISGGFRAGLVGGGLAALSLAVGLEGLPYLALAALYLAGDWCWRGRPALPSLAGFGLGLGLGAPLLFAAQTAPALWTATHCDALSPPWLSLAAGGLGFAMAATVLRHRLATAGSRIALAALCGVLLIGGFALAFPVCLDGPFPGMPALVRDHWLLTVNEMASLPKSIAQGRWEMLVFYPVVLLATLAATWMAWRGTQRRAWSVAALFLWPGLILGFFQFRGLYIASGFVPLVAGPVIDRALTFAAAPGSGLRRWGALVLGGCLVSTLWLAPVGLAEWLALASRTATDPAGALACQSDAAVRPLAALPAGTVLAPIFLGPSILLRTPHTIVAAPYHRAIPGLTAAIEGLGGTETDLDRMLDAFRVRYLVACPSRPADDLQAEPAFATRLARGAVQSDRLDPVALPGPLKVWRVVR
ncbi:hypothetical protein [Methylobacterium pseudosasicola]|uniref:4-amino-4-deoxy-L-arabinose transferase n=1 Tax=Methylobacterium pseudosasicola TaxID=582667 RepID=A0A1I4PEV5_9HYPH|nr:hypothetical protein [Methylobacterium pseudosasicola]SFM26095.1 hypothetical protein SAMN05192568_102456 [Methylobacterium pseudosasicola]